MRGRPACRGLIMRFLLIVIGVGLLYCAAAPGQSSKDSKDKKITHVDQFAGKTLDQWIKEIPSADRSKGEIAIKTIISAFPPKQAYAAVPALLSELRKHSLGAAVVDLSVRINCTIALGAIPHSVEDRDPKHVKEAVSLLQGQIADTQPQAILRYRAIQALGSIGPDAKPAMNAILLRVTDPLTWEIREAACAALGRIAQDKEK